MLHLLHPLSRVPSKCGGGQIIRDPFLHGPVPYQGRPVCGRLTLGAMSGQPSNSIEGIQPDNKFELLGGTFCKSPILQLARAWLPLEKGCLKMYEAIVKTLFEYLKKKHFKSLFTFKNSYKMSLNFTLNLLLTYKILFLLKT